MAKNNEPTLKESLSKIKNTFFTKDKSETLTSQQLLTEETPYQVTPSFIKHNGRVMSILNFYVRPNSNRSLTFRDVLDLIPISTLPGIEIHLVSKDILLKGQEKQKTIKKNSGANKRALKDSSSYEKEKNTSDNSIEDMRRAQVEDLDDYEMILDSPVPLVIFKWLLVIIGDDEESVDEQIETINTLLDQNHDGARWDSLPAEQGKEFAEMFDRMEPNIYDHTSTGNNYAGLSFAINSGLLDEKGVPLGTDTLSLSNATAFFDFDKYTRKQAFIFTPRSARIPMYVKQDEFSTPPMSSMIAQVAANQIMMAGHRAHHIILNDFNYFEEGRYFAPAETKNIFKQYDVNSLSINPLQGFGDIENVTQVYARLVQKIVNIFKILMGTNSSGEYEMNMNQQSAVLGAVNAFYYHHELWTANASQNKHKTRIVNITRPETYPTMGLLLNEFTTMSMQAARENRENKADNLEALEGNLRQALTTHMDVLGRTTTIEETSKAQVYYNFNKIPTREMREVQLLNILDYVIYTAKQGDVIVIHGFDNIKASVAQMIEDSVKAAQRDGIRFIFAFDTIVGTTGSAGKMNDVFNLQPSIYKDLDTDADWSMIGQLVKEEVDMVANALNQPLGEMVENGLQAKIINHVLVHRRVDNTNNFISLAPIL